MGLKDSIAFQQIALVVQSGLQGVCVWGGACSAPCPSWSWLWAPPPALTSLLVPEGQGDTGEVGGSVGDGTAGRTWPGYREQRFTEGWLDAQGGTWRVRVGRGLEWLGFLEADRR